jgi:hypothetical protein
MDARELVRRRVALEDRIFADIVVWQVPRPVPGSAHLFKYRLALVARGECVLRYDNEAGKGDHRHVGALEEVYEFVGPRELMADFLADARRWIHDHGDA